MSKIFYVLLLTGTAKVYAASPIEVNLKNGKGENVGTAMLTEVNGGVKVKLSAKGLSPGPHAVHFHDKASCTAPKFESAGGHFAPANKQHGDVPGGPHAGDMANLTADAKGQITAEFLNPNVKLSKGDNSLLKVGGTSLVIHAKADDRKTQPSGDSGDRVVCGEIKELVTK
jgi:Cu-Zn family superoxide dismutase